MTVDLTSHLKTCRRSHPHEEMDDVCERYTEYERELAALRAELALTTGTLESRERNIETLNATIADMEVRHADEYNELQSSFEDEGTKRERAEEEVAAQCCLNAMGAERGAKLMAELAEYRKWAEIEIADLRSDCERHIKIAAEAQTELKAQAAEAYADVDEWAAHASEYFMAKWDLHGTLQKWRDRFGPDAARKGEQ